MSHSLGQAFPPNQSSDEGQQQYNHPAPSAPTLHESQHPVDQGHTAIGNELRVQPVPNNSYYDVTASAPSSVSVHIPHSEGSHTVSSPPYKQHRQPWSTSKKCCVFSCITLLIGLIVIGCLIPFMIQKPEVAHVKTSIVSCDGQQPNSVSCASAQSVVLNSIISVNNKNIIGADVKAALTIISRGTSRGFGLGKIDSTHVSSRGTTYLTAVTDLDGTSQEARDMLIKVYTGSSYPVTVKGSATVTIAAIHPSFDFSQDAEISQ
jgi:hypothetical protein